MRDFAACFNEAPILLMEGALGLRLKREYGLPTNGVTGMADLVDTEEGRAALRALWIGYRKIADAGRLPTLAEAAGMAMALSDTALPYLVSCTIQADGRLIDGHPIHDAIRAVDDAAPHPPLCYMTNCVHPAIAREALSRPFNRTETVRTRFLGIQADSSPLPYAELDGAGDARGSTPEEPAEDMMILRREHRLRIFGGCCGTDERHMKAIARRLVRTPLQTG